MGRNLDSSCKQCRRVGEKLFLKGERCTGPKCGIVKRNFAPGFHGPKGKKRLSDYGLQLQEKQKAKKYYGMLEKQFHLTFVKASTKKGDAGVNFLKALESRLDNVIFRLGWATSRSQARQLVTHGHFTINGRKTDIPSFVVKVGQVLKVKKSSESSKYFRNLGDRVKKADRPSWLNFDVADSSAKALHEPKEADLPQNFNVKMIIEYYSK